MSPGRRRAGLSARFCLIIMISLYVKEETDSTNDDLWELYRAGRREPAAVLAGRQRKGRGRRGDEWFSGVAGNLYLSILLFIAKEYRSWLPYVPLRAALAAIEVLREYSDVTLGVKWPNDLMSGDKKVGGALVESKSPAVGSRLPMVIGIGVNLNSSVDDYPVGLREKIDTLGDLEGKHFPTIDIAGKIIYNLETWLGDLAGRARPESKDTISSHD